jgi:CRISPR-associated protein Cmr6
MIRLYKNKGKYVFYELKGNKKKVVPWRLYKNKDGKDVYTLYEASIKGKKSTRHCGLNFDKLTNIFNQREAIEGAVDKDIHNNIDECLKENRNLYKNIDFNAKVLHRLIVGLGEHSVFETNIKLHHTYGIPYIPGSAVKGCFRSHIIINYFEGKEETAKNDPNFIEIFGVQFKGKTTKGKVIFMDIFPKDKFLIKNDIMTPHYQNGKYTDDGAVIPIGLLAVEGTSFRFVLRISNKCSLNNNNSETNILKKAQTTEDFIVQEFIEMLSSHGIGAKTSVGYGYFEEITKDECLRQIKVNNKRIEDIIEKKI